MTNIKPLILDPFSLIKPVPALEIENEISFLSPIMPYGLYFCLVRALKCAKGIISLPLAEIMNMSILNKNMRK